MAHATPSIVSKMEEPKAFQQFPPLPTPEEKYELEKIPTTIKPEIGEKQPNGFYKLVGDTKQLDYYKVLNRSAPILAQISPDVPGMRAVSDTLVFVPEKSLTEENQAAFASRAVYLDKRRLGTTGMTNTLDEVLANESIKEPPCVRMDPCPEPTFKDLECCAPDPIDPSSVPLAQKTDLRPPIPIRDYDHKDSTWGFMVDRPFDKYAMIIMGVAVGVGALVVLVLLIWAMMTRGGDAAPAAAAASVPSTGFFGKIGNKFGF